MRRRQFVQSAVLGGAALPWASQLFAVPAVDSRFLLVFLRGGYDAMSLLVPADSSFYREARPNIAIPAAATGRPGFLPLNAQWGLHPVLEASVWPLVQRGQVSFVPFAGTDDVSRSHFETQDSIELGQPLGGRRDFQSGFMNRLAAAVDGRPAIAFTDQLPLVLRGSVNVANVSLKGAPRAATGAMGLQAAMAAMYRDHPLQARVEESFQVRDQVAREMAGELEATKAASSATSAVPAPGGAASDAPSGGGMANTMSGMAGENVAANRNAISAKGFELEARRMARLMRDRYALGFIDVGGWDTHVGQGAASGYLASRLDELGRGLAGFADEIGPAAWRSTTVVVVSEFGRTMRENGNRGTDHGHGSVYWVLGGGLRSPVVTGEQLPIEARTLFQNRDLPVLNEVSALLGGLFARQFGLSASAIDGVFPGARPLDLGLI